MLSRSTKRSLKKAFTLLELIVVIVILGILAALAIPTFNRVITRARERTAESSAEAAGREALALAAFRDGSSTITSQDLTDALADTNGKVVSKSQDLANGKAVVTVGTGRDAVDVALTFTGTAVDGVAGSASSGGGNGGGTTTPPAPEAAAPPVFRAEATEVYSSSSYYQAQGAAMAGNDVFIAQRSAPGDPLARVVVTGSTGVATNHATGVAVVGQKGSGFFTLGTDRTTITVYGADAAVTRTITLPTALPSFYYTSASASGDVFYFMAAANDAQLYRVDATGTTPVVTTTVLAQGGNLTTAVKASRLMIAQSTNSLIVGTNNSNNGDDKIWRITLNADGSVASQTQLMTTGGSFYGTSQGFIRSGKLYYAQGSSVYAQDLTTGVAEAVTTVSGVPLIDSIVASGTDAYLSGGNRKLYKLSL